jgi:adenine-specific DNA-methyltransferase
MKPLKYKSIKAHYAHESSVVGQDLIPGTVYTPDLQQRELIYLLLKRYLIQNLPEQRTSFEKLWAFYHQPSSDTKALKALREEEHLFYFFTSKTMIDPCCGSGLLIFSYLEWLLFLATLDEARAQERIDHLIKYIENKVYASDIDPKAIEVYKSIMVAFANDLGKPITLDADHLFCGNSLLNTYPSFDMIVGNPPYIGEKGNLEIFNAVKESAFGRRYYEGKMDYFYFFIYWGYEHLKATGVLCFLTSNYFYTADGGKKLRHFMRESFFIKDMLNYENQPIFKSKGLHACLYTLSKEQPVATDIYFNLEGEPCPLEYPLLFNAHGFFTPVTSLREREIISRLNQSSLGDLSNFYDVKQGIVSGADRHKDNPIFVFTPEEKLLMPQGLLPYFRPFYKNSQINHFYTEIDPDYYLLYLNTCEIESVPLEALNHLAPYRNKLEKRREVMKGVREWYMLTWPRVETLFLEPKIVVPQRSLENKFAYSELPFFSSADVYYIRNHPKVAHPPLSLQQLTLILNSSIMRFWLYLQGKRKGNLFELYASPLKMMPIFKLDQKTLDSLSRIGDTIYSNKPYCLNDHHTIIASVDAVLFSYFDFSEEDCNYLKGRAYETHH